MDKNNTLILMEVLNPSNDIFFNDWKKNKYNASIIFKKVNIFIRAIRRFCLMKNLGNISFWFSNWFDELDKYETVIIHMNRLTRFIPEIISKKNPNIRIIGWYWNTITNESEPIKTNNKNIEYYSFDKADCEKYGLKYNIQYYCPIEQSNVNKEYDIYFIGRDKGREKSINEFKELAQKKGLICKFNIIKEESNIKPYIEIKKELLKTKAVLEINKRNQIGYTLRTLESLFYEIKLITDNRFIRNIDFYNSNNIFIIGEDSYDKLYDFINSKYDTSVNKYKDNYSLDAWFNNFNSVLK